MKCVKKRATKEPQIEKFVIRAVVIIFQVCIMQNGMSPF